MITDLANTFVDNVTQCWGCSIFDKMFGVISNVAAGAYDEFVKLCVVIFVILFSVTVLNAVWKNMKDDEKDYLHIKSMKPLIINSLVALTFLGMGVALPRFATRITFEPTAQIALIYTESVVGMTDAEINAKVHYVPQTLPDTGFFRPQLRDTIILLMKTTISQFQAYIKLGIAVMDSAFSWGALSGVSALFKHFIVFLVGLVLAWGFFKLFLRFCFCFVDIIVAMAMFAFFFPFALVLVAFRGDPAPKWISALGQGIGTKQIKDLISAIVALAAAVLTYTVTILIVASFFAGNGISITDLMTEITQGGFVDIDLDNLDNSHFTVAGTIVLLYVVTYIADQKSKVTSMILSAFSVSEKHDLSDKSADEFMKLSQIALDNIKKAGKTIVSGGKESGKGTK